MSVTEDDVRKAAKLARIALDEAHIPEVKDKLNGILSWIEQLNEVDVDGVEPMTSAVEAVLPLRADQVSEGGQPEAVLANAPRSGEGFFIVPKVVE